MYVFTLKIGSSDWCMFSGTVSGSYGSHLQTSIFSYGNSLTKNKKNIRKENYARKIWSG